MSVRLASYSVEEKAASRGPLDFRNIERLLEKYTASQGQGRQLYFQILTTLLTVPHFYHYEISKFVNLVWSSPVKSENYHLLAAVLPYYEQETELFASKGYTVAVFEELLQAMETNRKEQTIIKNVYNQIVLLNTLSANQTSLSQLIAARAPIKIV